MPQSCRRRPCCFRRCRLRRVCACVREERHAQSSSGRTVCSTRSLPAEHPGSGAWWCKPGKCRVLHLGRRGRCGWNSALPGSGYFLGCPDIATPYQTLKSYRPVRTGGVVRRKEGTIPMASAFETRRNCGLSYDAFMLRATRRLLWLSFWIVITAIAAWLWPWPSIRIVR